MSNMKIQADTILPWDFKGTAEQMQVRPIEGKTITKITGLNEDSDEVVLTFSDGSRFKFFHRQGCCENVRVNDVYGDVDDLLDTELLVAEERSDYTAESPGKHSDSYTWTFYTFRTIKGTVDVRGLGESNGYYSESVDYGWVP